jgi:hypothetical protein
MPRRVHPRLVRVLRVAVVILRTNCHVALLALLSLKVGLRLLTAKIPGLRPVKLFPFRGLIKGTFL